MLIGYARIATPDQSLQAQIDTLKQQGCDTVFTDTSKASKTKAPGLQQALNTIKPGDTFVICRLDRLGKFLAPLIKVLKEIQAKGARFQSLHEAIDTSVSKDFLQLLIHIAASERHLFYERYKPVTRDQLGRPPKVDREALRQAHHLYVTKAMPTKDILKTCNITQAAFYRYLKENP
jgi:Site-specific recombinases, DNA invertase Pin homologs